MTKDCYMTVRIPAEVEAQIRQQASASTRTLAAQILHYIKQGLLQEKDKK
jgi:hypothetical protein